MTAFQEWDDLGRALFSRRFRYIYDRKWKDLGQTQKEFAETINKMAEEDGMKRRGKCGHTHVSMWYTGAIYPTQYLPYIAKLLNVGEDYFSIKALVGDLIKMTKTKEE